MRSSGAARPTAATPEWWSNSTISLGTVAGAAPANGYYRLDRNLRVSFAGGNAVSYHDCAVRASDGSTRNCDPIGSGSGSGSFSIQTVGDARVMRFTGVPGATAPLTYHRIFVERGGKVYFGYRDKLRIDNAVRLNDVAMDALFAELGIAR